MQSWYGGGNFEHGERNVASSSRETYTLEADWHVFQTRNTSMVDNKVRIVPAIKC